MATLPVGPHRVEEMLKYCLDLAKQLLEANGAFFPFGAIVDGSGNRHPVVAELPQPAKAADAYRLMQTSMRAQYSRGEIVAGAIVAEASVPPELTPTFPDGVRIVVESTSISRIVFLPFKKVKPESKAEENSTVSKFEYGELIGVNVKPTLFTS